MSSLISEELRKELTNFKGRLGLESDDLINSLNSLKSAAQLILEYNPNLPRMLLTSENNGVDLELLLASCLDDGDHLPFENKKGYVTKFNSDTGNRTRACWVRASYPNP